MELLLWRWSTTAQIASALMIAVFFIVLTRSVRRAELQSWVNAWLANLAALAVTVIFWFGQPAEPTFLIIRVAYIFTKTLFVALLAIGACRFVRPRLGARENRRVVLAIAAFAVVAALLTPRLEQLGLVQSAVIAVLLGASAVVLIVKRVPGSGWLAAGFTLRAVLGVVEAIAYASRLTPMPWLPEETAIFLAAHSSVDTGAEWVIALGCVLILYRTIQTDLINVYSAIGLMMLFGIVKKNSILQVDYTNTLREEGMDRHQALIQANHVRLRPILMTTIAIVAGMLPIAFGRGAGSGSRASMAVTIIGGQILCLLLTLLITPVVYSYFDGMRAWRPSDLLSPLKKLWRPGIPAPQPVKTEP